MSVTSSAIPGRVSNSWSAPSIRTCVMAAPGIDDSRRVELVRLLYHTTFAGLWITLVGAATMIAGAAIDAVGVRRDLRTGRPTDRDRSAPA